jgi:hypothetical protein
LFLATIAPFTSLLLHIRYSSLVGGLLNQRRELVPEFYDLLCLLGFRDYLKEVVVQALTHRAQLEGEHLGRQVLGPLGFVF